MEEPKKEKKERKKAATVYIKDGATWEVKVHEPDVEIEIVDLDKKLMGDIGDTYANTWVLEDGDTVILDSKAISEEEFALEDSKNKGKAEVE